MKNTMRILILTSSLLYSSIVFSCGTVEQNFQRYWHLRSTAEMEEFLREHSCSAPINYSPLDADPVIASVVSDGIDKKLNSKILRTVLKNYNCVYGARNLEIYQKIVDFITTDKYDEFCNIATLKRSYIVKTKGGASLRAGPGVEHRRIGAIADGALIKTISETDDWVYGVTYDGEGYVSKSLLIRY